MAGFLFTHCLFRRFMLYCSQVPRQGGFKDLKKPMSFVTNNALVSYLRGAKEELEKITWPTRKTIAISTALVIVVSLIWAIYFGVLDYLLNLGLEALLKLKA